MKLYFTFNNDIEGNTVYIDMLKACLISAKKNTTLQLNAIYDGNDSDRLYNILIDNGVNVIRHSLSFYDKLNNFYDDTYKKLTNMENMKLKQAACNFMKFEIPLFEKDEDLVLYSDIDVLFLKNPELTGFYTKTLAAAPEFDQNYDHIKGYKYFNAGIMLLNVKELAKRRELLLDMLDKKQRPYQECWDQGFFNELYKHDFDILSNEYNWKPYWGINENTKIVHLHGWLKPQSFDGKKNIGSLLIRFPHAPEGYIYYFIKFFNILNRDSSLYIANLSIFLRELYNSTYIKRQCKLSTLFYKFIYSKFAKYTNIIVIKQLVNYSKRKLIKKGINLSI